MSNAAPPPDRSVERYAAMVVALREPFVSREEILGDAGVSDGRWRELETGWVARMRADADVAARYRDAFKKAKQGLRDSKSPREVACDVSAPAAGVQHEPSAALATEQASGPEGAAPSLVAMAPVAAVVAATPEQAHERAPEVMAPALGALDPLDVTAPPGEPAGPVLPFVGGAAEPVSGSAEPLEPHDAVGETAELRLEDLQDLGGPTPFADEPASAAGGVDETALFDALVLEEPLPFEQAEGASSPPPVLDLPPHDEVGETGFVAALDIDDPLPFDGASARAEPDDDRVHHRFDAAPLTLGQLAAVFVELQHGERSEVLAGYGLSEQSYTALESERRALPSQDDRFAGAWDEACERYRRWRRGRDSRNSDGSEESG